MKKHDFESTSKKNAKEQTPEMAEREQEILMWFVFLALTSEDSLGDVFEDLKRKDEEVALNVLEAMNCIVR